MQGNTLKTEIDRQTEGSCGLNAFALASGATTHTPVATSTVPQHCTTTHTPVAASTVPQHCTTAHTCRYQHCAPTLRHSTHTCRYQHCAPTLHHSTHLSLPALCPNTASQHIPVATSTVPQHCVTAHKPVATSTVPQYCKFLSHRIEQTNVTFVGSRNVLPTFGLKHIYIPSIFCVYCLHSTCTKSIFCLHGLYSILCLYFNPHSLLSVNILCRLYRISGYILRYCVYILSIFSLVSSIHMPGVYYTHSVYIPNRI